MGPDTWVGVHNSSSLHATLVKSLMMWNVAQRSKHKGSLISCGNFQLSIKSLIVCFQVEAQGSKYLFKIRAIERLGTELP